jgi:hypothetical protein
MSSMQAPQPQNKCLDGFPYSREAFRGKLLNLANELNPLSIVGTFEREFEARPIQNDVTPRNSSKWGSLKHREWYVPVDIGYFNDLADKQLVHIFVYFNTLQQPPRAIVFTEGGQSQCIDAPLFGRWMEEDGWVGGEQKFEQFVSLGYRKLATSIEAHFGPPLRLSDSLACINSLEIIFRTAR